jgi:hypothetical protein
MPAGTCRQRIIVDDVPRFAFEQDRPGNSKPPRLSRIQFWSMP